MAFPWKKEPKCPKCMSPLALFTSGVMRNVLFHIGPALMEMSSPNVVYQGHNEGGITPQEQGLMDLNPFTTTLPPKKKRGKREGKNCIRGCNFKVHETVSNQFLSFPTRSCAALCHSSPQRLTHQSRQRGPPSFSF